MKKATLFVILTLFPLIAKISPVMAKTLQLDEKELKLNKVLSHYHSPLQGYEKLLIETATKYHLDWALLAAISGTESSFAKRMPYKCINPFGWGIYGTQTTCFHSFEEAIQTVGKGIGTKYRTTNLATIAHIYNPTHTQKWLRSTLFFLKFIKNTSLSASELPLTL